MLIIDIPYSPVNLMVFIGEDERAVFDLKVKHQYPEWVGDDNADGLNFQNHIFIEDKTIKEVLLHETFHFIEWLFGYMEIEEEREFKANLGTHIITKVLEV